MQLQSKSAASLSNSLIITISKFQIMKKTYQSPEALIVKIQTSRGLLLSTSETQVSGDNGGWAKEEVGVGNSTVSDVNVWDEEW